MKKIFLTFALAISLTAVSNSYAQVKIDYYSVEVMDEIKATPEQKAAVLELTTKYATLFKDLKTDKSLSKEDAATERTKLIQARSKAYWSLLTPEQTKYLRDKKKGN